MADEVGKFAAILRNGRLVAFPTETVYGLGADAANADAVLRIYETKGRPRFNPLIVHCADIAMAEELAEFSPLALRLAGFWPAPLTLVLPMRPGARVSDIVTAGLATIALRVPAHELALALIRAVGRPLAAPSANRSGRLSPTTAAQVRANFGDAVPVLDGGACDAGVESTILSLDGDRVMQLRAGALPREVLESELQRSIATASADSEISAPGMLASHYAPRAAVRMNATAPLAGEAFLAFGAEPIGWEGPLRNLSPRGDLREAARNLFSHLHALDASGAAAIAVAPVPRTGLGEAINDRLSRAAAAR